jgi:tetratricopeptide (TPR) repeat protein
MRYVPHLIPPEHVVMPDYFQAHAQQTPPRSLSRTATVLGWIFGLLFLLVGLVQIAHPILWCLWSIAGLMLLPTIHFELERALAFKFTSGIKGAAIGLAFLFILPLQGHYAEIDQAAIDQANQKKAEALKFAEAASAAEKRDADSLAKYMSLASQLSKTKRFEEAIDTLAWAARFASTREAEKSLSKRRTNITWRQANHLMDKGKYSAALPILDSLSRKYPRDTSILLSHGTALAKLGYRQAASQTLQTAIELGSKRAARPYDRVNPIRRTIVGYTTRCCDGSSSSAKGRGACSHHGGVCNWNEPIYNESREF